jgi:hypothetical protein
MDHFEEPYVDGKMILKLILGGTMWTGFVRPRKPLANLRFPRKGLVILWPAEELSAFEEGFCCTELSWCNVVVPCGFAGKIKDF